METSPAYKTKVELRRERALKKKRLLEQRDATLVQHYVEGKMSLKEIGYKFKVSPSNLTRIAKKAGVKFRLERNPVIDGMKKCFICKVMKPVESYSIRKDGRPYAYCKPCDVKRVKKLQRRKSEAEKARELRKKRAIEEHQKNAITLLHRVSDFLGDHGVGLALRSDIDLYLRRDFEMRTDREG